MSVFSMGLLPWNEEGIHDGDEPIQDNASRSNGCPVIRRYSNGADRYAGICGVVEPEEYSRTITRKKDWIPDAPTIDWRQAEYWK